MSAWAVLRVSHLVPLGHLWLTLVGALSCKPSLPAAAPFPVMAVRLAVRQDLYATGPALDHRVVAPCRKDPS
ncbi:hypothetical protein FE391_10545 [Nonomuraea sp. KC401]|uniref:hypothetical protein n=1 Tax=unclassified Nonomuraea TaxID=2593643 RepID=UPI0010FF2DCE|nr:MULTISPECIES: hypothetical protein [unclassified Nonomuraea]NBE93242.1 hypothetical protein [Nonomuraea sp. K271]TLF78018.1 hypothetical protein FE391_10545 [Nonomuraea sp. KC401]